ncbi:unnamed protein product [Leptidea sinapis]|uniref:3'-5' exonuclease domain-containing protein n=1 Tax=Leptidea sinapis TaxID=189913 RepID=A0A5E4QET7_9NEOP|nr:unnamed protein product [Leptidea sinapis]
MSDRQNKFLDISTIGFTFIVGFISIKLYRKLLRKKAKDSFKNLIVEMAEDEYSCWDIVTKLLEKCKQHNALGFDCEWVTKGSKRQPVSLLQLSTLDGYCGLFRLCKMKCIPEALKALLEDENIFKLGVVPADDAKYLANDYGVCVKSTLDIRHFVELCGYIPSGLATLSDSLLGVTLDKDWRIRCSDWSAEYLTQRQVMYAATDAHVAIKIFDKLINKLYYTGGPLYWLRIYKFDGFVRDMCWKYTDVSYKAKTKTKNKELGTGTKLKDPNDKLVLKKKQCSTSIAKPLYHNCYLEAPDGELLCTLEDKKAMWYVLKELADVIKESPLTVRLRFEPSGRSVGDVGRYYQAVKENKCVVCGESNFYTRKNVVPKEYRKHFPELMKEHSSHDVLLLCLVCHQRSNMYDQAVRQRLSRMCDAPLTASDYTQYTEDADCKKIRSAARALLYQSQKHVLPEDRRRELEEKLLAHYPQHSHITKELLEEAVQISVLVENPEYEAHGSKVVEYFMQHEGLLKLEELWREHFLSCMRPRYLPQLWSIKHNEERMRVRLAEGRLSEEDMKLIGMRP